MKHTDQKQFIMADNYTLMTDNFISFIHWDLGFEFSCKRFKSDLIH